MSDAEEFVVFLNHFDLEEGTFAVGEITAHDVDSWLTDLAKNDFNLNLAFWNQSELVFSDPHGFPVILRFDGESWSIVSKES